MTIATQITLFRILLTPVFVTFAIYHGQAVAAGDPAVWMRNAAVATFAAAALSDAIDGWVARRFRQESRLGRILDPLADKLLIVAALLTLSLSSWPARLPLWFVVVVITREFLAVAGAFVVDHVTGSLTVQPHWTGKVATVLLFAAIAVSLLHLDGAIVWVAAMAAVFTLLSGARYLGDAARQMHAAGLGPGRS